MKPPELKRFNEGDYPNAPSWFSEFLGVLNRFMEQVVLIMSKNITIGDNVTGRYFETTFKTQADYATGGFSRIFISWPFPVKPNTVLIAQISAASTILTPVSVQWIYGSRGLTITYIAGLTASTDYTVNFLCL